MDTIAYLPLYMLVYALAYHLMFTKDRSEAVWNLISGLLAGGVIYFFAMDSLATKGFDPLVFSLTVSSLIVLFRLIQLVALMRRNRRQTRKAKEYQAALTEDEINQIVDEVILEMDMDYPELSAYLKYRDKTPDDN